MTKRSSETYHTDASIQHAHGSSHMDIASCTARLREMRVTGSLFFSRMPFVVYVTWPAKCDIWKASFFLSGRFSRLFVTH